MCGEAERANSIAGVRGVKFAADQLLEACGRICFKLDPIGTSLREVYRDTVEEGVPEDLRHALDRLGNEGVEDDRR